MWAGGLGDAYFEVLQTGEGGDTVVIDDSYVDFFAQFGFGLYLAGAPPTIVYTKMASLGLGTPVEPGEGVFAYSLRVTANSQAAPNYLLVKPLEVNIEVVESRN